MSYAQPRRELERGPCGKMMYLSREEAQHAVLSYRKHKGRKTKQGVYHCRACHAWHFGRVERPLFRERVK